MDYPLEVEALSFPGYDQWLQEVDAQVDLDLMFEELEASPMRFYSYHDQSILDVTPTAIVERTLKGTETYPMIPGQYEHCLQEYQKWYRTVRKPGRRPQWLKELESNSLWDLTSPLPNETIVVEDFND